ncbi:hypothetical protein RIF29_17110 [Crotalaria pallida]|uniref:Uncharacterized protein n=1 Tax=Crotalaria pallida TaxID=3830 RepID=A0AAN9FGJ0_CROPI
MNFSWKRNLKSKFYLISGTGLIEGRTRIFIDESRTTQEIIWLILLALVLFWLWKLLHYNPLFRNYHPPQNPYLRDTKEEEEMKSTKEFFVSYGTSKRRKRDNQEQHKKEERGRITNNAKRTKRDESRRRQEGQRGNGE